MKKILGNTYPHKELIKEKGGRWDKQVRAWFVPDEVFEEVQKAVGDIPYMASQIWEECPVCGKEPIYLEVGVCKDCAVKGRRR